MQITLKNNQKIVKNIIILLLASSFDLFSTKIAISYGLTEANPLMCLAIQSGYFIPIKLIIPLLIGLYLLYRPGNIRTKNNILMFGIILYTLAALYNTIHALLSIT